MQAVVGRNIVVKRYTNEFFEEVKKRLTFSNPEYEKKEMLGKYLGATKKYLTLYERHGNDLILPFGMLAWCFRRKDQFDEGFRNAIRPYEAYRDYKSKIIPYPYQEEAINAALKARNGIIVAPCGSGKTQIALEIAARLGMRTLWITHTLDLLKQSMNRAKALYGLEKEDYGTITGGNVDVGRIMTFATVQTMSSIDLSSLKDYWQVVIVDECHRAVGTPTRLMMFWKVVSSLSARYKFGLTATPKRADGLEPAMYALLGEPVHTIGSEAVKSTTCPVEVVVKETGFAPLLVRILDSDGTVNHNRLLGEITANMRRNALVCVDAEECEKPCLVLTDRVNHALVLKAVLGEKARLLCGSEKKADREKALADIKNGDAEILVATYPIAKEGLDIPSLRSLILATPTKNETTIIQSCGRVGRACEGKSKGIVYDYVDDNSVLKRSFAARKNIYKRAKYLLHFST